MNPTRILLFEDDPGMALLTKEALEKSHYAVDTAPDGTQGLKLFSKNSYDVVLLDLEMPDMTGLEVFRLLQGLSPKVLGIMVTGSGDEHSAVEALKSGVADYIVKAPDSAHLATLPTVIERALEHEALKDEQQRLQEQLKEHAITLEQKIVERTKEIERSRNTLEATLEETHRLETSLVQAEKLSGIGQLAAGIAHELNSPLTGVIGLSRVLIKRTKGTKKFNRLLKDIHEAAVHAAKVVTELSAFARPSEGKVESFDLRNCIERTLRFIQYQLNRKGTKVTKRFSRLPQIRGDRRQLQQVFLNMITNARDALNSTTPPTRKELIIGTRPSENKESVEVFFEDSGHGIQKEHLQQIFDPFFTTKEPGKGTGLGLSISYTIVKNHGGTIEVDSEVGKGTTFTIRLPIEGVQ
ncbi:MAG: response regulator [Deltaproteobacteria bacterium]|nr:response regulator [Deltaproteobacteria bacterium]